MNTHLQSSESGRPQVHLSGSSFREVSSSWAPAPTILAPPFELCESCGIREGKLIDSRWDAPAFLVCTRCHG